MKRNLKILNLFAIKRDIIHLCTMKYIGILALLFLFFSCKEQPQSTQTNKDEGVEYAKWFSIEKRGEYTLLSVIDPATGIPEKKYCLGKSQPADLPVEEQFIKVPVQKIIALSSTHIGMLAKLGAIDKIVGISNINYVYNEQLKSSYANGHIRQFDNLGSMNAETAFKTGANVVVYSGFEGSAPAAEQKLAAMNVLCIPDYDWKEQHPLGRAEWIRFFGALLGKEQEADQYFNNIEKEYMNALQQVGEQKRHPSLFSGMMYGDIWYMPEGNSFHAKLFSDAGADYGYKNSGGTGSVALSFEEVLKKFQYADVWMNVEFSSKKQIMEANGNYKYFDAFRNGKMYTTSHAANNYWENSAVEPHKMLKDIVTILYGNPEDKLYYYKRVNE